MSMSLESTQIVRPSRIAGALSAAAAFLMAMRQDRRTLTNLDAMDDHILRDIGLSRADVMQARLARPGTDRIAMLKGARRRNIG